MIRLLPLISILIALAAILSACSEDSHGPDDHDHDLITRVLIEGVADGTTDTLRVEWRDADGPGGNAPVIDTLRMSLNTQYHLQARLFNNDGELTATIDNEKEEHQFLWGFENLWGAYEVMTMDPDANVKLYSRRVSLRLLEVGPGADSATLNLQLYHYDNPADKVSGEPGNETDLDVSFPLVVIE